MFISIPPERVLVEEQVQDEYTRNADTEQPHIGMPPTSICWAFLALPESHVVLAIFFYSMAIPVGWGWSFG